MLITSLATRAKALTKGPTDLTTPEGRAQERHRRAVLSAAASALAKIISVATALVSVPLTLHYLGAERYGMWMTMSSLVAVLSFADFGIGNGLLNVVAEAHGRDDRIAMRQAISSGSIALSLVALAIVVGFALVYGVVPWFRIFNVNSPLARAESGPALAVFICSFALAIPTNIVQRVQMGLQRGFFASLWQCTGSVMALGSVLIAIRFRAGLPLLVLALSGAPLLAALLNSVTFFGVLQRDIRPSLRFANISSASLVARSGALFLLLQIVAAVTFSSDNLIIAQILGASVVPQYAVPERMFSTITMVLGMAMTPLWPAYREALARGDRKWVRKTLVRSFAIAVGCSATLSPLLVAAGPWILNHWVGRGIHPSKSLLFGLGVWKVIEAFGNAVAMFLNGAHIIKVQVIAGLLTATVSILLEIFLVREIGVAGAVWATIVAFTLCAIVPQTLVVIKFIQGELK